MFKLRKYLKGYTFRFFVGPFFKFLEAVFELIVPLVMIQIMKEGINNKDINYILKMGVVLILLGVFGYLFSLICQYFASVVSQGFGRALRHDLFDHINKLSFSDIDRYGTSQLITRLTNDVYQAQTGIAYVMRLLVRSPFIVIGSIVCSLMIDPILGIVFCVVGPIISILLVWMLKVISDFFKKIQKKLDVISLHTRENLTGVRVVRAFSKQEEEIEKFNEINDDFTKLNLKVSKLQSLLNPLTFVIINIGVVVILYVGGIRIDLGFITQEELIAFVNYMTQVSVAVVAMANLFIILSKANASSLRIYEVLQLEKRKDEGVMEFDSASNETVRFDNVSLNYTGKNEDELSGLTFTLNKNEMVGIIGATGSGKSSLVNMIDGFYLPTNGDIYISGINIKDLKLSSLHDHISIVSQKAVLYSGTIRSNLEFGRSNVSEDEIINALKVAQAYDFVMEKENKLDEEVTQGGKNFSGGQRQRLTIARSLVKKPDVLILDDSSSALDFKTDRDLRFALRQNITASTIIIVSQRITSILDCDKIIVLDDGKIVGMGTHNELLKTCKEYKEIYNSQVKEGDKHE